MATLFTEKYVASKAYGRLSQVIANIEHPTNLQFKKDQKSTSH